MSELRRLSNECTDDIEDLFELCRINVAEYEKPLYAIFDEGHVVGALVYGTPYGDLWAGCRFSVVVHPAYCRRGYCRRLVNAFLEFCQKDGLPPEALVVNYNIMPMLTELGFTPEGNGPIWSKS